jgi:hypothetical protein
VDGSGGRAALIGIHVIGSRSRGTKSGGNSATGSIAIDKKGSRRRGGDPGAAAGRREVGAAAENPAAAVAAENPAAAVAGGAAVEDRADDHSRDSLQTAA